MRNRIRQFSRLLTVAAPALVLVAVFWSAGAFATTCKHWSSGVTGDTTAYTTLSAACTAYASANSVAAPADGTGGSWYTLSCGGCDETAGTCTITDNIYTRACSDITHECTDLDPSVAHWTQTFSYTPYDCTSVCSSLAGKTVPLVMSAGAQPAGTLVVDGSGCIASVVSTPTNVIGKCGGGMCAIQTATYTGGNDLTESYPSGGQGNCMADGSGGTVCTEADKGKNCGTFNGDEVCVASIPNGSCVSYASGGVACAASTTPPVPNNGTSGTPATPTGQVQQYTDGTTSSTVNYYSSSTVAASTSPVAASAGGQNTGNAGTNASSGTGTGAGTNPANGDCGATGVDCSGDGSTPTLSTVPTIGDTSTGYVGSLSSVPIVAAVTSIGASVPSGSCPTGSFTVYGTSYTIDEQCTLWDSVSSIVSACMLALYAILGIKILLSA